MLPNDDVLVSESQTNRKKSANDILLFRDADHDGVAELKDTFMTGLNQRNTDGVYRYPYKPGQMRITAPGQKILDLPAGSYNNFLAATLSKECAGLFKKRTIKVD